MREIFTIYNLKYTLVSLKRGRKIIKISLTSLFLFFFFFFLFFSFFFFFFFFNIYLYLVVVAVVVLLTVGFLTFFLSSSCKTGGRNGTTDSLFFTSISFIKKLACSLASAIACTLMPYMLAYVSRFIELTQMTPVIFRTLVHS